MELRHLKTFRTVATLSSFYKAAKVLNYAQSTVSEQIKALENDLNVKLFIRSGKTIVLTEAGELLLQHAQKVLNIEEEIKSEIANLDDCQGTLSIRIPETVSIHYLPLILKKFHIQYPKVRCSFTNCTYFSLQQEFQSGITDLAFLITDDDFRPQNLEVETLFHIPLVLVTYPEHPLLKKNEIIIQDFNNHTIILPKNDCNYRMIFEKALTEGKVEPNIILDFNSLESIKKCIIAGTGIGLLSEISVKEELKSRLLIQIPYKEDIFKPNLLMIWRKDKWMSPALKAFIDITRDTLVTLAA